MRSFWERFSCYLRIKFAVFIGIWVWECYGEAMEILREWERNIIRIPLEYSGNTLGIFWEYSENTLGTPWEHSVNTLGILWEYFGNPLRILWELSQTLSQYSAKDSQVKTIIVSHDL